MLLISEKCSYSKPLTHPTPLLLPISFRTGVPQLSLWETLVANTAGRSWYLPAVYRGPALHKTTHETSLYQQHHHHYWLQLPARQVTSVVSNSLQAMDCSPPGFSVHGILRARLLMWVANSSSRGSAQPRDRTESLTSPAPAGRFFTTSAAWEALVPSHFSQVRLCATP